MASTAPEPVDNVLKKFYKLVHPDLLHAKPEQRKVNSESFGLLQRYLEAVKDQDPSAESLKPFTLKFYNTKTEELAVIPVNSVDIGDNAAKKERHLFKTLTSVFSACKFESGLFSTSGYSEGRRVKERYALPGQMTIVKFLITSLAKRKKIDKQEVVKATNQFNESAIKIANDLKLKTFGFDIPEQLFQDSITKYRRRYNILNQFVSTTQEIKNKGSTLNNLEGSHVLFGKRTGIDSKGRLVLNANELVSDWLPHITNYTAEKSIISVRAAKSRQALEQQVADVLGVSQFNCTPDKKFSVL